MFFTQDTKIGYILASPEGREILLKHAPELKDSPYIFFTKMRSLSDYVTVNQSINRSEDWLRTVMNELSSVEYEVDTNTEILPLSNYESIVFLRVQLRLSHQYLLVNGTYSKLN